MERFDPTLPNFPAFDYDRSAWPDDQPVMCRLSHLCDHCTRIFEPDSHDYVQWTWERMERDAHLLVERVRTCPYLGHRKKNVLRRPRENAVPYILQDASISLGSWNRAIRLNHPIVHTHKLLSRCYDEGIFLSNYDHYIDYGPIVGYQCRLDNVDIVTDFVLYFEDGYCLETGYVNLFQVEHAMLNTPGCREIMRPLLKQYL